MCERYIDRLPLAHLQLGTWPTTQACALTGSQTSDLSVCRLAHNPLSHTNQGYSSSLGARHPGSLIILRDPENVRVTGKALSVAHGFMTTMSKMRLRVVEGLIQCHSAER